MRSPVRGEQAGGFGIEDDLAHGCSCRMLPAAGARRVRARGRARGAGRSGLLLTAIRRRGWRAASARSLLGVASAWPLAPSAIRPGADRRAASSALPEVGVLDRRPSPAVTQPRAFQPWIHSLMPFCTYWLNRCARPRGSGRLRASRAWITASSSMRLLVVPGSPPKSSFSWPPASAAGRPSRRGRDCPCRRRRNRSRLCRLQRHCNLVAYAHVRMTGGPR